MTSTPKAGGRRPRVWHDWNSPSRSDGTVTAVWLLKSHDGRSLVDYPEPTVGQTVAAGSEDVWFEGTVERVERKDGAGFAWVRVRGGPLDGYDE
jgi:hypothetical protein